MAAGTDTVIDQAAARVLDAWHAHHPEAAEFRPANLAQAYAIQETVSIGLGTTGGWRVCQPGPDGRTACAPLPLGSLHVEPARLAMPDAALVRVKPGLCFRIGVSLPDYDAPYSREQVRAAVASCHPAIDVLQERFAGSGDTLSAIADSCGHWQLVYGQPTTVAWDLGACPIPISVFRGGRSGKRSLSRLTRPVGDALALLQWLANYGARSSNAACGSGGVMVGQMVTIDLATEELRLPTDRSAHIVLGWLGGVTLRFD